MCLRRGGGKGLGSLGLVGDRFVGDEKGGTVVEFFTDHAIKKDAVAVSVGAAVKFDRFFPVLFGG